MSIVKDVPYVYETEKDLALGVIIKNRLNNYILFRMERLIEHCKETGTALHVSPSFLDKLEEGAKALLSDLNVRKGLARNHIVNYIIDEFGAEIMLNQQNKTI